MSGLNFNQSQSTRLGQQMKLAPKMIQSMEILQMPLQALQERIEQELEANIALERIEPGLELEGLEDETIERELAQERKDAERAEHEGERELVVGQGDESLDFERLGGMEESLAGDIFSDQRDDDFANDRRAASRNSGERDRKMDAMNNTPSRGESLVEQLLKQWAFVEAEPAIVAAGARLIEHINDDGLLATDLETILEQAHADGDEALTAETLAAALPIVQVELEPAGIGARSIAEGLLLQIDAMNASDASDDSEEAQLRADARRIISDWFNDFLENRLPQIEKNSGISIERIQAARTWMHRLELSPGKSLVDVDVAPIIPDVIVEYDPQQDQYVAVLAEDRLLLLQISPNYERISQDKNADEATKEFITRNVQSASWLIEAIAQRENTMLRVVRVVLVRQRDFFDHGPQHLKPLPMTDVADQLGVHVGTVSRAVSGKWMQTPRGYFPLRRFFSGGLETDSGRDMSWEAVKEMVRTIVNNEDPAKPLSDQALANALAEQGIKIARRTVVKYRDELGIPAARRRKVH